MASADSPLPIMNSPAGMSVISIFTPPPKSTVIFSGPAAAFFASAGGFFAASLVCPHALPAMPQSTTHAATKVFIMLAPFFRGINPF